MEREDITPLLAMNQQGIAGLNTSPVTSQPASAPTSAPTSAPSSYVLDLLDLDLLLDLLDLESISFSPKNSKRSHVVEQSVLVQHDVDVDC